MTPSKQTCSCRVQQELAIYEASILSADEAAIILLNVSGEQAFVSARNRLITVTKAGNDVGVLFWKKVLLVLLDMAEIDERAKHEA